jgi:hypothetical protein
MILLEHYLMGPDWILEIPRSPVGHVSQENGWFDGCVNFTHSDSGETGTVQIQPIRRGPYDGSESEVARSTHRVSPGAVEVSRTRQLSRLNHPVSDSVCRISLRAKL